MKISRNNFLSEEDLPLIVPITWSLILKTCHPDSICHLLNDINRKNDLKRFIKFTIKFNDHTIFSIVHNIIKMHHKEYLPLIEKYMVLL